MKIRCPVCRKIIEYSTDSQWRPFCSERCRLVDLGQWLEESYAIPGEPVPDTEIPDDPTLN